MTTALHPIQLLTRTDGDVTTIYHCVFLIHVDDDRQNIKIIRRIPSKRTHLDTIESGIGLFVLDAASKSYDTEKYGNFVITTSDGTRFFAYWKAYQQRMFMCVSRLPLLSFSRKVFRLLSHEASSNVLQILTCLCETPIYPCPGLSYDVAFSCGNASIEFSDIEQVNDSDSNNIVLRAFNPKMMVEAWEALILERKVLVVTSVPSILGPCCEFLRRLTLPLVSINAFVPHLPIQLLQAIEAPFPYLLGADIKDLRENQVDVSETIIIDLDSRSVIYPQNKSLYPDIKPPESMIHQMLHDLNDVIFYSLGDWVARTRGEESNGPTGQEIVDHQVHELIQIFVRSNMSLFCARSCSVSAFYRVDRNAARPRSLRPCVTVSAAHESKKKLSFMGYHRNFHVSYGFMQLFHEKVDKNEIRHFTPCWIEMDDIVFAVYEYADDMPLFYIYNKDIEAVLPSSMEPEGHVFELTTKNHSTFLFATTDTDSRRKWIDFIEECMKEIINKVTHEAGTYSTKSIVKDSSSKDSQQPMKVDTGDDIDSNNLNDENGYFNSHVGQSTNMLRQICFGINELTEEEDDRRTVTFRNHFMKTQMVSFLRSQQDYSFQNDWMLNLFEGNVSVDANFETLWKELVCSDGMINHFLTSLMAEKPDTIQTEVTREGRIYDGENDDSIYTSSTNRSSATVLPSKSKENMSTDYHKTSLEHSASLNQRRASGSLPTSPGFMRFFRFASSRDVKMDNPPMDSEDIQIKQREKELADAYVKSLKDQLYDITRSRRQCHGEIRKQLVEDRINVMAAIFNSVYCEDFPRNKVIEIPLTHIVSNNRKESNNSKLAMPIHQRQDSFSNEDWFGFMSMALEAEYDSSRDSLNQSPVSQPDADEELQSLAKKPSSDISEDSYIQEHRSNLIKYFESALASARDGQNQKHLVPIYQVQLGYLYQQCENYDQAIKCYSEGSLIDQRHLVNCVAKKFQSMVNAKSSLESQLFYDFLRLANGLGPLIGLTAYRLVVQIFYRDAVSKLSTFTSSLEGSNLNVHQNGAQRMHLEETLMKRSSYGLSELPDFEYTEKECLPTDALNEHVTCSKIDQTTNACDLSVILLSRLKELVRDYCTSPVYKDQVQWVGGPGSRCIEIKYIPGLLDGLQCSSAFKSFEIQSAQLQKISLSTLTLNQRLVFFSNIFNMMTVHGMIIKGSPGKNILDRTHFMKNCRYNIGGYSFSLLDIEHGILRNASSKPLLFGLVSVPPLKFSDSDPRKAFALDEPKPNISFFLFLANVSSPALGILRDPANVDHELKQYAKSFLSRHVRIVHANHNHVVLLPQIISMYWEDFGRKRRKVLKYIVKLLPPGEVQEEIKAKLNETDSIGSSSDIDFSPIDWAPSLIL